MHGNRELISQALANLVDNAIKYAAPLARPAGERDAGEVVVRRGSDGDKVLLSVADRGPGIPEADRKRAVERFVRLETEPLAAGLGPGPQPGVGGGAPAWRRTAARGQCAGPEGDAGAADSIPAAQPVAATPVADPATPDVPSAGAVAA